MRSGTAALMVAIASVACAAGESTESGAAPTAGVISVGGDTGSSFVDPSISSTNGGSDHGPPPDTTETGDTCPVGAEGCDCTPGGACDEPLACLAGTCTTVPAECGNAQVETGEACDDGPANADTAACKSDCTAQVCGDGFIGPGEGCDDGNADDTDACTNACALASCGDGMVQMGEGCDDANADDTDACLGTCVAASCGDGIVHAGVEQCDDGNADDTDACVAGCAAASCGDGHVQAGVEQCDDGNLANGDSCSSACACPQLAFAGAGDIAGWSTSGGWGLYNATPISSNAAVTFTTQGQVFGTDGNRVPPYPGAELEASSATTTSFVLPSQLEFRSWHVDEGGPTYDSKRISVSTDGGASWTIFVDCSDGALDDQPFCVYQPGPRAEGAFDDVVISLGTFAGQSGQLRFEYASGDTCCTFEQGWYIDDANFVTCG